MLEKGLKGKYIKVANASTYMTGDLREHEGTVKDVYFDPSIDGSFICIDFDDGKHIFVYEGSKIEFK